jgi:hypothetical protein
MQENSITVSQVQRNEYRHRLSDSSDSSDSSDNSDSDCTALHCIAARTRPVECRVPPNFIILRLSGPSEGRQRYCDEIFNHRTPVCVKNYPILPFFKYLLEYVLASEFRENISPPHRNANLTIFAHTTTCFHMAAFTAHTPCWTKLLACRKIGRERGGDAHARTST